MKPKIEWGPWYGSGGKWCRNLILIFGGPDGGAGGVFSFVSRVDETHVRAMRRANAGLLAALGPFVDQLRAAAKKPSRKVGAKRPKKKEKRRG